MSKKNKLKNKQRILKETSIELKENISNKKIKVYTKPTQKQNVSLDQEAADLKLLLMH